ncbi:unnamed protein product, partial [Caenorhabditis auriculariae]
NVILVVIYGRETTSSADSDDVRVADANRRALVYDTAFVGNSDKDWRCHWEKRSVVWSDTQNALGVIENNTEGQGREARNKRSDDHQSAADGPPTVKPIKLLSSITRMTTTTARGQFQFVFMGSHLYGPGWAGSGRPELEPVQASKRRAGSGDDRLAGLPAQKPSMINS